MYHTIEHMDISFEVPNQVDWITENGKRLNLIFSLSSMCLPNHNMNNVIIKSSPLRHKIQADTTNKKQRWSAMQSSKRSSTFISSSQLDFINIDYHQEQQWNA